MFFTEGENKVVRRAYQEELVSNILSWSNYINDKTKWKVGYSGALDTAKYIMSVMPVTEGEPKAFAMKSITTDVVISLKY